MSPSDWPNNADNFSEPVRPERTPLKSAGSSSRAHSENHRDLGDAIEKLQQFSSKISHLHNGIDSPKLNQANTHEAADTDAITSALHHTLGLSNSQMAKGNHLHNGTDSPQVAVSAVTNLQNSLNSKPTRSAATLPGWVHPFLLMSRASFKLSNGRVRLLEGGS